MSSRLCQSSRIVPATASVRSAGAATESVNTGVSVRLRRIQNVTTRITAESRNGTRQPQESRSASGSV